MNIGEAAKCSGVSAKMIRYYESTGLIAKTVRTEAGYRVYSDNDVHTLRFIRRARDLGFSVAQISELVALWVDRNRASTDVKTIALKHVEVLQQKARELQDMARTLSHLAQHCHGDARPECPIIEGLANDDAVASTASNASSFDIGKSGTKMKRAPAKPRGVQAR